MPSKTEHVLFCRLTQRQRSMYEAYIKSDEVVRIVRGNSAGQLFGPITMLRKIANHPDLVCAPSEASFHAFIRDGGRNVGDCDDSDIDDGACATEESMIERSGKLEVLSKVLPLWRQQGHRVLIFCQWKKMLDIIQRFTQLKGWKFARLDGNTNIASRQSLVDTFNTDTSYFVMLCTTRTGGVGLNLTGANRILIYDPDFNPSSDAQARERSWRFGQVRCRGHFVRSKCRDMATAYRFFIIYLQEKDVTIYRLITAGTIEEKIYQRQIFKTALSNKVLQDPKQRRLFSQRDLCDLFSLGDDTGSVRSGGDGVTETSRVTRGIGIVDTDADVAEAENDDNTATLKRVMKSQGLAGIFDHHSVELETQRKSTTIREMEEHAKRVSREAVQALKNSVSSTDGFPQIRAGFNETNPTRFVAPVFTAARYGGGIDEPASASQGPLSSANLLASLRNRTLAVESGGRNEPDNRYSDLVIRLKDFVGKRRPTTDDIVQEFDHIADSEVAIFRGLLKEVAEVSNGRWKLK